MTRRALLLGTCLSWLAVVAAVRAEDGYRIEITINYGAEKQFEFQKLVSRSQGSRLEFSPESAMQPFVLEARQALAMKQGYHPRIYGQDYYKIVSVRKVEWKVKAMPGDRTVAKS